MATRKASASRKSTRSSAKKTRAGNAGGRRRSSAPKSTPRRSSPRRIPAARPEFSIRDLGAGPDAPKPAGGHGEARTVIYVHGIGNKPVESVLKCQWDTALFGHRMGDRTRLAYWVNRDYYPVPEEATCSSPDYVEVDEEAVTTQAIMALTRQETGVEAELEALSLEAKALAGGDREQEARLVAIAERMMKAESPEDDRLVGGQYGARILPFEWLRKFVTPKLTRAFLRDVHDFLYVPERRAAMLQSVADRMAPGGGPFVVIGHSQGSMVAYEVLRQLDPRRFQVPLFVTIGSPLGIEEVQDVLKERNGGRLVVPECVGTWLNVADPRDVVAIDSTLADEFKPKGKIVDLRCTNPDSPRHPHSGTGYLSLPVVREAVHAKLGVQFSQTIAPFVLAGDLVEAIENGSAADRHPVLIQLSVDRPDGKGVERNLDEVAASVQAAIVDMLSKAGEPPEAAQIERLKRYLAAKLTRLELETLRSRFRELKIEGIWRNAQKRAFISRSTHTVQARPANLGYGADGENISWAVLDTGIRADHPHFQLHRNVVAQYDCTRPGPPTPLRPGDKGYADLHDNGHGTHVAAIIAGTCDVITSDDAQAEPETYSGMAPKCRLYGFKVLRKDGTGDDSSIIKALDEIARLNEDAGQLVIHGINLSLGGDFDPAVFGCGHTPLCQELRRLWRQGVLVCLAAGNEGHTLLRSSAGYIRANMDITIGDPANLEEAIAVGSVHKTNPHTYGISYFSSRGPTADGRRKPDVVAPGERIVSARHDWQGTLPQRGHPRLDQLYVEMSGTSMATPHVSGVLAAFLSLRREFIGYPDRVKEILLKSCIDLRRDPYMQGAGVPNLIQMLAFT